MPTFRSESASWCLVEVTQVSLDNDAPYIFVCENEDVMRLDNRAYNGNWSQKVNLLSDGHALEEANARNDVACDKHAAHSKVAQLEQAAAQLPQESALAAQQAAQQEQASTAARHEQASAPARETEAAGGVDSDVVSSVVSPLSSQTAH